MPVRRNMAPSSVRRTLKGVFQVLVWTLMFTSPCKTDSQASGYFNNPMINFGDYFYISFPNKTLDLFIECLCDMTIVRCNLTVELVESLTTPDKFPLYYTITRSVQQREDSMGKPYTSSWFCPILRHLPKYDINCYRLLQGDTTCKRTSCIHFSINHTNETCPLDCTMLFWQGDFLPKMYYINFGFLPQLNKGGVCPSNEVTSTPGYVNTIAEDEFSLNTTLILEHNGSDPSENKTDSARKITRDQNIAISNAERNASSIAVTTADSISVDDTKSSESSGLGILRNLILWCTGAACLIILVSCITGIVIYHRKGSTSKTMNSSVNDSVQSSVSNVSQKDSSTDNTDSTSGEATEELKYHTLDEMAIVHEQQFNIPDVDDIGYTKIGEKNLYNSSQVLSRHTNGNCSSLPQSENSIETKVSLTASSKGGTSSGLSNSPPPTVTTTTTTEDSSALDSPFSSGPNLPKNALTDLPITNANLKSFHGIRRPCPCPQRRSVDLENHQYLCRVNLRQDKTIFGDTTEVKLIRTQHGHLELVDVQDELPAFTEYYTRILLINQDDGTLGVAGLAKQTSDTKNEELSTDLLHETSTPHSTQEEERFPHIILIGSLDVEVDVNFEPSDYLTVLDIEQSFNLPENGEYLTVLDIEQSFNLPENGEYLTVLDIEQSSNLPENGEYLTVLDIEQSSNLPENGEYLTVLDIEQSSNLPESGEYLTVLDIEQSFNLPENGEYLTVLDIEQSSICQKVENT